MRIAFANPNATVSMTGKIAVAARAAASAGTHILALTNAAGPPSAQGEADGRLAELCLLALLAGHEEEADAFAIACFDDTALEEARARTAKPVVGIGEAAMREAARLGGTFSVVTTLCVSVPVIEANVARYGLSDSCRCVSASDVAVLDLEREGSEARERVAAEIERALLEDRPGAVVLGCVGMADHADTFGRRLGLPVIDGMVAAVRRLDRGALA